MSTAKNSPQSAIVFLKKYVVLLLISSLVLVVAAVYAATQIYTKKDNSSEYVYQDKSGTKVVLRAAQCGYSVEILKSMSEQFGKTRDQVKAMTLYGDGWEKEGCWLKLDKTNEVAVSTEPGKVDTVLEFSEFTKAGIPQSSSAIAEESKSTGKIFSQVFSGSIDPANQDAFAYIPKLPEMDLGASYTFLHRTSCAEINFKLAKKLQQNGHNPSNWRAGTVELGGMLQGRWERMSSDPLCYLPEPSKKQILVLIGSDLNAFPYKELSTEPFKAATSN
ncbi:hypothetical protein ATF69_3354 [Acidovorax delafieldii]|uniref:Uncharacterized protein n=1 Tax=Acidovorax delafieldii TaxID=47920 RepID=A0A561XI48_ACIDE|nr:hypothetical protein [Acidovorax delafieldii]TWG35788.1 hypothetical protein ATF69_3354 [Acidovorax delafieldii]